MIPHLTHTVDLDPTTHTYRSPSDPDHRYCSVTQMLEKFSRPFDAETEATKYSIKHGIKKAEVLKQWEEKGERAADLGSIVHAEAESVAGELREDGWYVPKTGFGDSSGYVAGVYQFYDDHMEARLAGPIAELRICHPDYRIAGTVDLITRLDGQLCLLDWKTSEHIDWFGFGGKKMYAPANHLPDSNAWHYLLQLSTYRFILKEIHGVDIESQAVIHLMPDGEYRLVPTKYAEDLVPRLLKKNLARLKREDKQCKEKDHAIAQ